MIEAHDDLIISLQFRINRRPPFSVTWKLDKKLTEEESLMLFHAVRAALEATAAMSLPVPARKM